MNARARLALFAALWVVCGLALAGVARADSYSVAVLDSPQAVLGPAGDPGSVTFRISRQGSLDAGSVDYRTVDGTAVGGVADALAPIDYQAHHGRASMSPGVDHLDVRVALIPDAAYDGPETFAMTIANPMGGQRDAVQQARAEVRITNPVPKPCTSAAHDPAGDQLFSVNGRVRSLLVHVPAHRPGVRMPLLLALHGFRSDGYQLERYTGLSALADHDGFVVAYPSAPAGEWYPYAGQQDAFNDLAYVAGSLERLDRLACIDDSRRALVGVSNGAGEAARAACDLGARISAVALVSGDYRSLPACRPPRPVSVLELHGTLDRVVPYLGRPGDHSGSVPKFLASWRRIDRCRSPGVHTRPYRGVERSRWSCARHTQVAQLKVAGMGHDWPGHDPAAGVVPGPGSGAYEVWRFLAPLHRQR
ncbi:MAG TPA: PHB depolymerase family esterase [Solirubrobacteraceae bacterium]|nr:PHB depolymerase family esterase [Solirubrobacteraceae bacterium]